MKKSYLVLISLIALCSCGTHRYQKDELMSIQLTDRNGFSETISIKEKLTTFEKVDYLEPQPHSKIFRVYNKTELGLSKSVITSYHPNGLIWQYLEIINGRAHGKYQEWFSNGILKANINIMDGNPDVDPASQASWIFDETSYIYDESGALKAAIRYFKGKLEGESIYYYPNGATYKILPYKNNELEGNVLVFKEDGSILSKATYSKGIAQGIAEGYWENNTLAYRETYDSAGKLIQGFYYDKQGNQTSQIKDGFGFQSIFQEEDWFSLVEYKDGIAQGIVREFLHGNLYHEYSVVNNKKHGLEVEYYPLSTTCNKPQIKLQIEWVNDSIHGSVKTFYLSGKIESQREFYDNKKHGVSLAYYEDGSIMFIEEYEMDSLNKATYFKKGDTHPTSKIENGTGVASLFDSHGNLIKKIRYEKGKPEA